MIFASTKSSYDILVQNIFHVPVYYVQEFATTEGKLTFGSTTYYDFMITRLGLFSNLLECGIDFLNFETDAMWWENMLLGNKIFDKKRKKKIYFLKTICLKIDNVLKIDFQYR